MWLGCSPDRQTTIKIARYSGGMFIDSFNPKAALAATSCPRCLRLGLTEIDSAAYDAAPPEHLHPLKAYISPSLYARCDGCSLLMQWPDCTH